MKIRLLTGPAVCFTFLILSSSLCLAQGRGPQRLYRARLGQPAVTAPAPGAVPEQSKGYNFTFIDAPGSLFTDGFELNPGATAFQQLGTGPYVATESSSNFSGFILESSSEDGVTTETFTTTNYPGATQTDPYGINDQGQMVGEYEDSKGIWHGFQLSGGKYTAINVPFQGAVDTYAFAINDAGDIVGVWDTGNYDLAQGFELAGGVYTQIQFPGATFTGPFAINSNGEIAGSYALNGQFSVTSGFTLSGGTYTNIAVPGAIKTALFGINDSGELVGWYCTPAGGVNCEENYGGNLGFVGSNGVYSTLTVPSFANTFLYTISNAGVIAGQVTTENFVVAQGFIAVPK